MKNCETFKAIGYEYTSFYDLWSLSDNSSDDYFLDVKLFAVAQKDVFIMLTPTTEITSETLFLELGMYTYGIYFITYIFN